MRLNIDGDAVETVQHFINAGEQRGRQQCQATHAMLIANAMNLEIESWDAGYLKGQDDGHRIGQARGEARGRVQGAVVMMVLVGLSWWWRKR